jgi:hypothetical protein
MEILNSTWLIKMLEKSSKAPRARLLNLFDILEDWLDAPSIAASVRNQLTTSLQVQSPNLQNFLALEAAKAGAAMPEILANQLYFMAVAATQEKLQANNPLSLAHASSFKHAKIAANALISAQTKTAFNIAKSTAFAMAASFTAICIVAGGLLMLNPQNPKQIITAQIPIQAPAAKMIGTEVMADPNQTAALMAQIEQMRHGNCQLIEAIQLPDNQKGIYLNMVVNGQVSTNPHEQAIAFELLQRTRCNYTPMLMANSTG